MLKRYNLLASDICCGSEAATPHVTAPSPADENHERDHDLQGTHCLLLQLSSNTELSPPLLEPGPGPARIGISGNIL